MADELFRNATYEEKMQMLLAGMTEKRKQENREQVKYMCQQCCGKCPNYQGTRESSFGFCMEGKSSIITQKEDCLCGQCPISKMMSLRWDAYCIRGSAKELSNSEH